MSTASLVPVEEYLATHYRPDCDYIDGEVRGRSMGEYDHGRLQGLLFAWFLRHEKEWKIRVVVEQRVRISPTRYRIPDVCVISSDAVEQVISKPPLLCVEILSPDDSLNSMQERIDDYFALGVPCVWVLNPRTKRAWVYTAEGSREARDGVLRAADAAIALPVAEVFEGE